MPQIKQVKKFKRAMQIRHCEQDEVGLGGAEEPNCALPKMHMGKRGNPDEPCDLECAMGDSSALAQARRVSMVEIA